MLNNPCFQKRKSHAYVGGRKEFLIEAKLPVLRLGNNRRTCFGLKKKKNYAITLVMFWYITSSHGYLVPYDIYRLARHKNLYCTLTAGRYSTLTNRTGQSKEDLKKRWYPLWYILNMMKRKKRRLSSQSTYTFNKCYKWIQLTIN